MATSKIKISAVVNTRNEEKNIERCLKSLEFCDEIIVVDMESEDETVALAKKYTHKIYSHKNVGYVEPARNMAISKALGDWILIVDADEVIPKTLAKELVKVAEVNETDFVRIPRKNIIFGQWMQHSRWWPDYNVRFFKRGVVTWQDEIHSVPITEGTGTNLKETEELAIEHFHYNSVDEFILRSMRYADLQAKELMDAGYQFETKDLISKPIGEFLSRFFAGEGYKDGLHGFIVSVLQFFAILLVYLKIWQTQGNKKVSENQFANIWTEVFLNKFKELRYWFLTFKINSSKTKSESIYHKLVRKFSSK
jgi:glycosyltransferase involved in cell wall biosynthesis